MAQISKGKTFVTGEQVTALNLNKIVDDATLQPGAITAQAPVTTVATTNLILTTPPTGSALNRVSLADVVTSLNLAKTTGAQSFSGNLTMVSGADIALTSQSILSLPSGASQTFASGASQTFAAGATLTLGQDPTTDLQAATKKYVDNNFIRSSEGVVLTDPLAFSGQVSFNNNVTLSNTTIDLGKRLFLSEDVPASDKEAVCKSYVVSTINSKKIADIRFKSTATPGTTLTVEYAATIPATVARTLGSNIATLVFSSATYFNVTDPFFIPGQYIGVQNPSSGTGIEAKLYKILTVTAASKTITIETDATTAVSGVTQNLSIVYINTAPPALPSMLDAKGNKNIKSVYVCLASNKNYINYWYDSETGDTYTAPTTSTTIKSLKTVQVSGQAITRGNSDNAYFLNVVKMVQIESAAGAAAAQPYNENNPTGFDVTSKGAHVGYFFTYNDGLGTDYVWDAHVVISK